MRHCTDRALLFVCGLVLAIISGDASAHAALPALHWVRARGAESCIDPIALAQRVEAFTGPVFVAATAAELSLTGEVAPEGKGFRVRIALSGVDGRVRGERIVRGGEPDCRSMDSAIAFIMALTLDPSLSLTDAPAEALASFAQEVPPEETLLAELAREPARPGERSEWAPKPAEARRPEPAPPSAPGRPLNRAEQPRVDRVEYNVSAGAQLLGYVLPSFAPGVQLALGVAPWRWLLLSLGFELAFGTRPEALSAEGHASFRALGFSLRACPRLVSWQRFTLSGSLGGLVTGIRARGTDFKTNRSAQLWLPALSAGLLGWLALPKRVALWAELAARIRLSAQRFDEITGSGQRFSAHRPGPVGLHVALGAAYLF